MDDKARVCPKCQGEMEEGHVWGNWGGDGFRWIKKDLSTMEKIARRISAETNVRTFSCKRCGYIERYVDRSKVQP